MAPKSGIAPDPGIPNLPQIPGFQLDAFGNQGKKGPARELPGRLRVGGRDPVFPFNLNAEVHTTKCTNHTRLQRNVAASTLKGSVPEYQLISIPRICFVIVSSALGD